MFLGVSVISVYVMSLVVLMIAIVALVRKVDAYSAFIDGAKEGLKYAVDILPYIASMVVATTMLRASGFFDMLFGFVPKTLELFPPEIFTLILVRPLSGSASLAVLHDIFTNYSPDSPAGTLGSILQGSTDTTLYIITVYLGGAGIYKYRHALKLGIFIDMIAALISIVLVVLFLNYFK